MQTIDQQSGEERLDQLIADYLRAVRQGNPPSRTQLLESHPDLAEDLRSFFADHDAFRVMATPLRQVASPILLPDLPPRLGSYELLKELARGGMGVVYKARQYLGDGEHPESSRLVALKFLLAGQLAGERALRRFRTEAETIAALNHPHIIPIHEVGVHDQRWFLSMKLIEGGTLAEHRLRFQNNLRPAIALLVQVAEAVHHAHQRGVLHRDLKPSNILLEQCLAGTDITWCPYVSDFGLARWLPLTAENGSDSSNPRPTVYMTNSGDILGTPSYMAPEQAAGRSNGTIAVDVYGLGAILYDLLTGRPPFKGATSLDTILLTLNTNPVPPRQLNKAIDRDLETICLKCLQREPERRYASAHEVAAELGRYLCGEPILARPVGPAERLVRWTRRQPVLAAMGLALAASVLLGLGFTGWQWSRAETNLAAALANQKEAEENLAKAKHNLTIAEEQRTKAQANLKLAHSAVNEFATRVLEELENTPGMQPLRRRITEASVDYSRIFLDEGGRTPEFLLLLADGKSRLASIYGDNGDKAKAYKTHQEAEEIYRQLLAQQPLQLPLLRKLVGALNNQALHSTDPQSQAKLYRKSLALVETSLKTHPDRAELLVDKAVILVNQAGVARAMEDLETALATYQQALAILEPLARRLPELASLQADLALALRNLAMVTTYKEKNVQPAIPLFERACEIYRELVNKEPRNYRYQVELAGCYHYLSNSYLSVNRKKEARDSLVKAHQIRVTLVKENPENQIFRTELAMTCSLLGQRYDEADERLVALRYFEEGRDHLLRLLELNPTPKVRADLACAFWCVGCEQGAIKNRPEERKAFEQAAQMLEALVKENPERMDYRADLARTLSNLGLNLHVTGHSDEAVVVYKQGLGYASSLSKNGLKGKPYRDVWNVLYANLATAERTLGHVTFAAEATLLRRELWPNDPNQQFKAACELMRTAALFDQAKTPLNELELKEQQRLCNLAMDSLRNAISLGFKDRQRIEKEQSLDSLRSREDFKGLLKKLP